MPAKKQVINKKKTCLQRPLKKARVKVCQQQPSGKRKIYDYTHSVCNASKQHNQASKEHKKHTRKSESSCIFYCDNPWFLLNWLGVTSACTEAKINSPWKHPVRIFCKFWLILTTRGYRWFAHRQISNNKLLLASNQDKPHHFKFSTSLRCPTLRGLKSSRLLHKAMKPLRQQRFSYRQREANKQVTRTHTHIYTTSTDSAHIYTQGTILWIPLDHPNGVPFERSVPVWTQTSNTVHSQDRLQPTTETIVVSRASENLWVGNKRAKKWVQFDSSQL